MIRTYQETESHCISLEGRMALESAASGACTDLHNPTDLEEHALGRIIGADIPEPGKNMPDLNRLFGYSIAMAAMAAMDVSIVTTLVFFRRKVC